MTVEVQRLDPAPAPSRLGQATAVEQSRAVAEVAAAVQVAQACPRSVQAAVEDMRRSCQQPRLADRAFYRYNRGDGNVTGPSVYLARELARCWGNFQSGVAELRRDDEHGQSEMQAWAWDVQTNARTSTTFIVPHARDTKKGRRELTELRDVYENNANNGARRLREMILGLLPTWFVEEAKDLCTETLKRGNGEPLEDRIRTLVDAFEQRYRLRADQLEQRIGYPLASWTPNDVATLRVIWTSLARGEIRVEDEFPTARITADDITPPAPGPQREQAAQGGARVEMRTWAQINARFNALGVTGPGQTQNRRAVMARIVGHQVSGPDDLTVEDGAAILHDLDTESAAELIADVLGPREPADEEPGPVVDHGGALADHDGPDPSDSDAARDDELPDPTIEPGWPVQ